MIDNALFTIITTFAGFSALAETRLYPNVLPQKPTVPAATIQQISGVRAHSHQGATGWATPRFQIDCYASTKLAAKALGKQVRLALQGHINSSPLTVEGTWVQAIFAEGDRDFYDNETQLFRHSADYFVHHNEEVP